MSQENNMQIIDADVKRSNDEVLLLGGHTITLGSKRPRALVVDFDKDDHKHLQEQSIKKVKTEGATSSLEVIDAPMVVENNPVEGPVPVEPVPAGPPTIELEKSTEHWWPQGTVIIFSQRGKEELGVGFRVHQDILASKSNILRDSFNIGMGGEPAAQYEGCPVLPVDDTPEEISMLLKSIYSAVSVHGMKDIAEKTPQILTILNASSKYEVHESYSVSLRHLAILWPNKLSDFESTVKLEKKMEGLDTLRAASALAILNGRRGTEGDTLLPSVYYYLCYAIADITEFRPATSTTPPAVLTGKGQKLLDDLPGEHLKVAIKLREQLKGLSKHHVYKIENWKPSAQCTSSAGGLNQCRTIFRRVGRELAADCYRFPKYELPAECTKRSKELLEEIEREKSAFRPFVRAPRTPPTQTAWPTGTMPPSALMSQALNHHVNSQAAANDERPTGVCMYCRAQFLGAAEAIKIQAWCNMPTFLRMGTWEEILKRSQEDIAEMKQKAQAQV